MKKPDKRDGRKQETVHVEVDASDEEAPPATAATGAAPALVGVPTSQARDHKRIRGNKKKEVTPRWVDPHLEGKSSWATEADVDAALQDPVFKTSEEGVDGIENAESNQEDIVPMTVLEPQQNHVQKSAYSMYPGGPPGGVRVVCGGDHEATHSTLIVSSTQECGHIPALWEGGGGM
jgi:hypothetical protein